MRGEESILAFRSHLFLLLPARRLQSNIWQSCAPRATQASLLMAGQADRSCEISPTSISSLAKGKKKKKKGSKSYMTHLFLSSIY